MRRWGLFSRKEIVSTTFTQWGAKRRQAQAYRVLWSTATDLFKDGPSQQDAARDLTVRKLP